MPTWAPLATLVRFGVFELDLDAGELRKAGIRLRLQKQPFEILRILVQRAGEVVTREELRSEIWSEDTFVDFDNSLNTAINKLRDVLGDTSSNPRFIETVPRRGYRFIAPVTGNGNEAAIAVVTAETSRAWWKILVPALILLTAVAARLWYSRSPGPKVERAQIVLGDFANHTGDSVFDGTLRQGLAVQLEQSPFLRFIPEEQIRETLRMMGRAANQELPPEVAREVCQRSNAAVALNGSISLIGSRYQLVLRAVDCGSDESVASVEASANDKDHVLDAVSRLAAEMRGQLGESLNSIRQYNIPLAIGTTPSLDALRCYTQGIEALSNFDYPGSVAWFQKAIDFDPKFAMAYWAMGDTYAILGETNPAIENTRKAFELRGPVSEREKSLIEANYYYYVLGDLVRARRSGEVLRTLYPNSEDAHNSLAAFAEALGQHELALNEYREALRLAPRRSFLYRDVAYTYLVLDRVEDASTVVQKAQALGLDTNLGAVLYSIAFYRDDRSEMARQVAGAAGKPEVEDLLLALEGDTSAYFGQLEKARMLSQRAAQAAKRAGQKETAASYLAASAVREALFGYKDRASQQSTLAERYSSSRDVVYGGALASIYSGDLKRGEALTGELAKRFPQDTVVQCNYLPTLRGKLALMRSKPQQAIDELAAASPCELGLPAYSYYNWANVYPIYVRGEVHLAAHLGSEAAAEFETIIDHRGIVLNEPIGALAYLQMGRAFTLAGETAKAKSAYQNFLNRWKDADPDIPLLKQAKAEYAKLQ